MPLLGCDECLIAGSGTSCSIDTSSSSTTPSTSPSASDPPCLIKSPFRSSFSFVPHHGHIFFHHVVGLTPLPVVTSYLENSCTNTRIYLLPPTDCTLSGSYLSVYNLVFLFSVLEWTKGLTLHFSVMQLMHLVMLLLSFPLSRYLWRGDCFEILGWVLDLRWQTCNARASGCSHLLSPPVLCWLAHFYLRDLQ